MSSDYLSIGYVLKPQGTKGEIKVEPLTDHIDRFDDLQYIFLFEDNEYHKKPIEKVRYSNQFVFLKLADYDNMDQAELLRGQYLWIPRSMSVALPENSFFITDIIGCLVETGEGMQLGIITDVISTGSNDVYVIDHCGQEILIPALKKVVSQVLLEQKKVIVEQNELEGLLPDDF